MGGYWESSCVVIRLLELQTEMLRQIATGHDLVSFAELLCRRAEQMASDVVCSIMTLDGCGYLDLLAGPSLPESYRKLLHKIPSGPKAGSCGTAAFYGREVIVNDIENDPLWDVARDLVLPLGLRACWSSPIIGENGRVLATFAFYYHTSRSGASSRLVSIYAPSRSAITKRRSVSSAWPSSMP